MQTAGGICGVVVLLIGLRFVEGEFFVTQGRESSAWTCSVDDQCLRCFCAVARLVCAGDKHLVAAIGKARQIALDEFICDGQLHTCLHIARFVLDNSHGSLQTTGGV